MSEVLTVLGWVGFYLGLVVGLLAIPLGLGGTFIILADAVLLGVVTGFERVGIWALVAMAALAIIGEVIESVLGVFTVRKFGASRWAMLGTFVGGIGGAILGSPILPVIGSLIGAFIGAFLGAFIAEIIYRRQVQSSLRAGWGAFVGRILAALIKFEIGIIMIIIVWWQIQHG